jgi:hypothetical protein
VLKSKKIFLLTIIIILINILSFSQTLMENQERLEKTVQLALDRILGIDNSIVYISLIGDSEKWEIRYTSIPQIEGVDVASFGGSQQTIAPGIPSLRFLTQSGGGEGLPLNHEIVQSPPVIRNKDVVLILDNRIRMGDLRVARNFVTQFLQLDENAGDKLTIIRENFAVIQRMDRATAAPIPASRRANWVLYAVIGIIILILLILLFVFYKVFTKNKRKNVDHKEKEIKDSIALDKAKEEETFLSEEEKETLDEENKQQEEENKIMEMQAGVLGNGARYFNFIDEDNVYKLKFLLQLKIAFKQATPKTIAVVLSCLPFKIASSILIEYPPKIQAEIVYNILTLQHFSENDMQNLESEIKENIDYLFAGKNRLKLIIEKMPGEEKKRILDIISSKYPGISDEVNSLIFLFEDLLKENEKTIARVFNDMDTEIIATSLVNIDIANQKKVINTLAKGIQSMVDQWLSLKANTASRFDIEESRQKILNYAQYLEREGFIELNNG